MNEPLELDREDAAMVIVACRSAAGLSRKHGHIAKADEYHVIADSLQHQLDD